MSLKLSREKAAQAWGKEKTKHFDIIPELAEEFAIILEEIWSQPWLGNATTRELLEELTVRLETSDLLDYRTTKAEG